MDNNIKNKANVLAQALDNAYLSEEDRSYDVKLEFSEKDFTEDITAMLYAICIFFSKVTGETMDLTDIIQMLKDLAIEEMLNTLNESEGN